MYKWRTIIFRYTILDCYYEFARLLDILIALSEATVYIDEFIVGPITHHALRVGFGVCMPLACMGFGVSIRQIPNGPYEDY